MDKIVAIVGLLAVLFLVGRGLPLRVILIIAAVAVAFSLIVVWMERARALSLVL
jgi:hypothetical protein